MPGFATVLPLAIVMVAGPQIITAVFLATSENWRKNSAAFLTGVLLSVLSSSRSRTWSSSC